MGWNHLTSLGKPPASISGGEGLPVSAGGPAPAEMPRSGNEVRGGQQGLKELCDYGGRNENN